MAGFPLLAVIQGRDNADADLFPGSYQYVVPCVYCLLIITYHV